MIHLENENDLKHYKSLKKQNRVKYEFNCSLCGKLSTKNLIGISFPFICGNCCLSLAHKTEKYKLKYEKTMVKRYGAKNYNNREKAKKTCLERYGGCGTGSASLLEKQKNTMKEKYGCEFALQSNEFIEKTKMTKYEKYGDENYNNHEQTKKTCLERYGCECTFQNEKIREKGLETCLKKHNSKNYNNREKAKKTCLERYGCEHVMQNHEIFKKSKRKISIHGLCFDSKFEIKFYEFLRNHDIQFTFQPDIHFEYEYDGKVHAYWPDFEINGKFYELKGLQFFKDKNPMNEMVNPFGHSEDGLYEAKHQCMLQNKVTIITSEDEFMKVL